MREKLLCLAAAAACLTMLAGCGGGTSAQPYTQEQAQAILDSGVFTDDLEELDSDTIWALYGLESGGLSREALTESFVRRSSGATCEELALLTFADGDAAQASLAPLETYLQNQIKDNEDYRAIQEQMEAIFQQYPKVLEAVDTETAAELSQQECAALIKVMELRNNLTDIEMQTVYFRGCYDGIGYLKKAGIL